jgi:hypothetical protein
MVEIQTSDVVAIPTPVSLGLSSVMFNNHGNQRIVVRSFIALIMEAVRTSETSARLHGATSQNALVFLLSNVRIAAHLVPSTISSYTFNNTCYCRSCDHMFRMQAGLAVWGSQCNIINYFSRNELWAFERSNRQSCDVLLWSSCAEQRDVFHAVPLNGRPSTRRYLRECRSSI